MKILITTGIYPPDIGGPATYTYNLAKKFLKSGHDVSVVTYGKPNSIDGIDVHAVSRDVNIFVRYFKYFLKVWQVGKNFDLIFCFDVFSVGLPSVLVNLFLRKKIIMRLGGDFFWEKECEKGTRISLRDYYSQNLYPRNLTFLLYSFVYWQLDYIIFSTEMQRDLHTKVFPFIADKAGVVMNPFPSFFQNERGIDIDQKCFLAAGRFVKIKNYNLLITAFKEIHDAGHDVKLLIYGSGPEKVNLVKRIKELDADSYIELRDRLPHQELIEKITESYACILPSLSEISPNFGLECLKLGTPLILTKENGLNHIFESNCLMIDPFDLVDIKNTVISILNKEEYDKIRNKSMLKELSRSWDDVVKDVLRIISYENTVHRS